MSTIKFRAWDKSFRMMKYFTIHEIKKYIPKKVILMQYTGLKDKNGKEIFEGDIIELKNKNNSMHGCSFTDCPHINDTAPHMSGIGVVGWNEEEARLAWWHMKEYVGEYDYQPHGIFNWEGTESIEVIGDIYSNPELIK